MNGREDKAANDLFYLAALIEYIARRVKQPSDVVATHLGREKLQHIYSLADVYHCDDISYICDQLIDENHLEMGEYDPVAASKYTVPTHWDIGKIYKRLAIQIGKAEEISPIDGLISAYHSPVSGQIHNFNSAFYYDTPENIFLAYQENPTPIGGTQ